MPSSSINRTQNTKQTIKDLGLQVGITNTVMNDLSDKIALARFVTDFAATAQGGPR